MSRRSNGEGSFSTKPDGRIEWRYYLNGERKRLMSRKDESPKDFRIRVRKFLGELDRGVTPPADNRLTLGEYLDGWLAQRKPQIEYEYWRRLEESIRVHIKPALGRVPLTKLTKQQVKQLYAQIAEKALKRNTVAKVQITLRKALNDAVDDDLILRNPAARVGLPPDKRTEQPTFKSEETVRIIEAARGNRYEALIMLPTTTGCRLGEVLGLRWQALDLDRGMMRIETVLKETARNVWGLGAPKTEHSRRTVLLETQAVEALRQHHVNQTVERLKHGGGWNPLGLVFCSLAGTPINRNNLRNREFSDILRRAKLEYLHPHAAGRHSTATQAIKAGEQLFNVQQALGHASISTTANIYAHAQEDGSRSVRDRLERLHGTNPEKLA